MPTLTLMEQNALEALVVSQIEEIRKCESSLQKRFCSFSPSLGWSDQLDFNQEILQLRQRTDRLSRMMDAMGGHWNQLA